MTWNIRAGHTNAVARGADRDACARSARGRTYELKGRVGAGNACVSPCVIYHDIDVIRIRAVIEDLAQDTGCVVSWKECIWAIADYSVVAPTRTIGYGRRAGRIYVNRQAVLLLHRSGLVHDVGDIENGSEG